MGEKIWTPWFIKFIHSRGYFNIYANFLHERALSVSHRDPGVNYGKTAGPDSQLLNENSRDINLLDMQPLSSLPWYDFCFRRVLPGRIAKKLDDVTPILHSMKKQKPIFLVSLLKSSETIVRNLICHFERLNIQNYIFMVPNSESDDLQRRGHPVIITDEVFDSIRRSKKKTSSEMIKEMVVKAYVIKICLESGFDNWVISSNMLPLSSNPELDSTDSLNGDFYVGKNSRFFFARSSSSSRGIWDEKFVQKFAATVTQDSSLKLNADFIDVVEKFAGLVHMLRLKSVDDMNFSLKPGKVNGSQSLPTNTKMISWSTEMDTDLVHKQLEELGMWIIDSDSACKAVVCHQS